MLKEAVAFVESRLPTVEVSTLLAEGEPAWVLREETRRAASVVVGSWHLSRRREMFTSASVALPLTAHAPCPVAVVPEPEPTTQQSAYFVVGVDGSPHSAAAVDVTFEEAALRGALLRALYVWHPPLLGVLDEDAAVRDRRVLCETVAGRTATHPKVELHHGAHQARGHGLSNQRNQRCSCGC
ncbi:universal stress protein [Streptomyces sp. NBC_00996]|uniref:universal stress protein n=1 Tax=Streptomyces sp. NBC_00996 TaxID=2903710 RepID=UPI0038681ABC